MSEPGDDADARITRSAAVLLLLWVLIWNGDALWGATTWFFHDLKHHHLPWRTWAAETWAAGEVPLWAPVAHGYPLLADGQAGILYPPNLLLYRLFSPVLATNLSVIFHQVWAAWGALWLARVLGRSGPASTVAGVAYGLSGFLISHLVYLGMFQVVAWVPWIVGLAVRGAREGGGWWGAAGLALGVAWLAGHPQMALYATYAALFGAAAEGWKLKQQRPWVEIAGGVFAMGLVAGLIALPQLWASAELVRLGQREGGVDAGFASLGSLPPEELVHAVLPRWFGSESPADVAVTYHHRGGGYVGRGVSYWEDCFYLGIPTVLLALAAGRAGRARPWWILLAIGVVAMLGASTPLFPLFRLLPGMGWFRFPVRAAVWVTLAVSMLAAVGVDRLGGWLLGDPARVARRGVAVIVGVAVLWGLAAIGSMALRSNATDVQAALAARLVREGPDARGPEEAEARAAEVIRELESSLDPSGPRVLWPLVLALATGGVAFSAARGTITPRAATSMLPLLVAVDLYSFGGAFNPRTPADEVTERPSTATWLLGRPAPFRATVLDRRVPVELDRELMSSNLGLMWGTEDVIVPSPLRTLRNEAWLEKAGLGLDLAPADEQIARFAENRVLADLSGVRWLLTTRDLHLPDLAVAHETFVGATPVRIYENTRALPRAFVVGCTVAPEEGQSALDAVLALDDPRGTAVVEGPGLAECVPEPVGEATVTRVLQAALSVEVTLDQPGWLVVTESWYPGMYFQVGREVVEPVRTDDLFMGIALPPGKHEVVVAYVPVHLYMAMVVSAITGVMVSVFVVRRVAR
jgi:hypothetical protein